MNSVEALFAKDITLYQEAFKQAAENFSTLSSQMAQLEADIAKLLGDLASGFDTPAGRKFMQSCEDNLLKQLRDQADVIQHVSNNLSTARTQYETVFTEFKALNRSIKAI